MAPELTMEVHAMEAMLSNLLADAFEGRVAKLRQWVRNIIGRQAYRDLPEGGTSLSELAFQATLAIQRHACDRHKVFESLRDELPGMAVRIQDVARQWGVAITSTRVETPRSYGIVAAVLMLGLLVGLSDAPNVSSLAPSRVLAPRQPATFHHYTAAHELTLARTPLVLDYERLQLADPLALRPVSYMRASTDMSGVIDGSPWRAWLSLTDDQLQLTDPLAPGPFLYTRPRASIFQRGEGDFYEYCSRRSYCRNLLEKLHGASGGRAPAEMRGGVMMDSLVNE